MPRPIGDSAAPQSVASAAPPLGGQRFSGQQLAYLFPADGPWQLDAIGVNASGPPRRGVVFPDDRQPGFTDHPGDRLTRSGAADGRDPPSTPGALSLDRAS